jgi:hypothetical protein
METQWYGEKIRIRLGRAMNSYKTNYTGVRDLEDCTLKPVQAKS